MNKKILRSLGVIFIILSYVILFLGIKYISLLNYSNDLIFLATLVIAFISLHFFMDIKKMYNWIFRWRWLLAIGIFALLVINGYNGSSNNFWNRYVDQDTQINTVIVGIPRGIRADEWMTSSPHNLSQLTERVNLSPVNDLMMNKDNKVSMYPAQVNKSILSLIFPENWGYILFDNIEIGYSWNWYFYYILGFMVSLELFYLLTKKNKILSVLGAFLTAISPAVLWWNGCIYQTYGGLAILIVNRFINDKNVKNRILLSIAFGICGFRFIFSLYPAWIVTYFYIYLAIFFYLVIENKEKLKWKDLLYFIIFILVVGSTFIPLYLSNTDVWELVSNTVYPGARVSLGGGTLGLFFNYYYDMLLPYTGFISNPCEASQYISLFPVPIVLGIMYLIKQKKASKKIDLFVLCLLVPIIFMSLWCMIGVPEIISKLTLMTFTTTTRASLAVSYGSVILLIYLINNYSTDNKIINNKFINIILPVFVTVVGIFLSFVELKGMYGTSNLFKAYTTIAIIIFSFVYYFLFNLNKKNMKYLLFLLFFINFVSSILISPINKGLSIMYEKPFAKEIQKIRDEDKEAVFIAGDTLSNYIIAQGVPAVFTTNFVPNLDLYYKLDPNKEYENVYNRYSHSGINFVEGKTTFELVNADTIIVNLSYDDICLTGGNYIATISPLEETSYYHEIWNNNNEYIYRVECN